MKIKLGEHCMFESRKETLRTYAVCMVAIMFICYITGTDISIFMIFAGLETLLLLWLETTYYPYGIKEGD